MYYDRDCIGREATETEKKLDNRFFLRPLLAVAAVGPLCLLDGDHISPKPGSGFNLCSFIQANLMGGAGATLEKLVIEVDLLNLLMDAAVQGPEILHARMDALVDKWSESLGLVEPSPRNTHNLYSEIAAMTLSTTKPKVVQKSQHQLIIRQALQKTFMKPLPRHGFSDVIKREIQSVEEEATKRIESSGQTSIAAVPPSVPVVDSSHASLTAPDRAPISTSPPPSYDTTVLNRTSTDVSQQIEEDAASDASIAPGRLGRDLLNENFGPVASFTHEAGASELPKKRKRSVDSSEPDVDVTVLTKREKLLEQEVNTSRQLTTIVDPQLPTPAQNQGVHPLPDCTSPPSRKGADEGHDQSVVAARKVSSEHSVPDDTSGCPRPHEDVQMNEASQVTKQLPPAPGMDHPSPNSIPTPMAVDVHETGQHATTFDDGSESMASDVGHDHDEHIPAKGAADSEGEPEMENSDEDESVETGVSRGIHAERHRRAKSSEAEPEEEKEEEDADDEMHQDLPRTSASKRKKRPTRQSSRIKKKGATKSESANASYDGSRITRTRTERLPGSSVAKSKGMTTRKLLSSSASVLPTSYAWKSVKFKFRDNDHVFDKPMWDRKKADIVVRYIFATCCRLLTLLRFIRSNRTLR